MSALDLAALRALADAVRADAVGTVEHFVAMCDMREALSPDVVLALLDRLERAERAPAVSRDAGEVVDAVLRECGCTGLDLAPTETEQRAMRIVQRALDAAHESGAEAEREQRAIERRHGAGR